MSSLNVQDTDTPAAATGHFRQLRLQKQQASDSEEEEEEETDEWFEVRRSFLASQSHFMSCAAASCLGNVVRPQSWAAAPCSPA